MRVGCCDCGISRARIRTGHIAHIMTCSRNITHSRRGDRSRNKYTHTRVCVCDRRSQMVLLVVFICFAIFYVEKKR